MSSDQKKDIPSKTYFYGKTKITIVSPLVNMSSEERVAWFESEWEKGNLILKDIVDAASDCLRHARKEDGQG
ncbi:hypothetical protein [Priestia koreensis]|uniref:hypothetical protein n=1 Tax=Priestia koreensis TaxID=284581 RepID=UPI0030186C48